MLEYCKEAGGPISTLVGIGPPAYLELQVMKGWFWWALLAAPALAFVLLAFALCLGAGAD
jgi:hypothetical protein